MDVQELPDYVRRVLSRFSGVTREATGWVASCPCPTHGESCGGDGVDSHPSLRLTVGEHGRVLVSCRTGCKTEDVLGAASLSFAALSPSPGERPMEALASKVSGAGCEDTARLWHTVYSGLLSSLPLGRKDAAWLEQATGLPHSSLLELGYRSMTTGDRNRLALRLFKEYGNKLYTVPGFYGVGGSPACVHGVDGIVFPLRDVLGRVRALKTRRLSGEPRYCYWSSAQENGPSPGSPCHIPSHLRSLYTSTDGKVIRVTEGERKADVAFLRTGLLTISCPGVAAWSSVPGELRQLRAVGCPVERVILSFDMPDVTSRRDVLSCVTELARELEAAGYLVGVETWPCGGSLPCKGIDDALVSGLPLAVTWGKECTRLLKGWKKGLTTREDGSPTEAPVAVPVKPLPTWKPTPFPLQVFPEDVQRFVRWVSEVTRSPCDFAAGGVLAATSRCAGTSRVVEVEEGWKPIPSLYMCQVARPSMGKSPALKHVMEPLWELQLREEHLFAEARRRYQQYQASRKARRGEDEPLPTPVPEPDPCHHYIASNFTLEALAPLLKENEEGPRRDPALLLDVDEILGWVRSWNQYRGGKGSDEQEWLSMWNGSPTRLVRKTEGSSVTLPRSSVTVLGGIQPEKLVNFQTSDGQDDGFLPRILYCYPGEVAREKLLGRQGSRDGQPKRDWARVVNRLLTGLKPDTSGLLSTPHVIPHTQEAYDTYAAWVDAREEETDREDFPSRMRGWYGKTRSHLLRLSILIHLLRAACGDFDNRCPEDPKAAESWLPFDEPLEAEDINRAIVLLDYFTHNYEGVLDSLWLRPEERRINEFVAWVRNECDGVVKVPDIYRTGRFGCTGRKDATKLCQDASDRGYGETLPAKGKGSTLFKLFPERS